MNDVESRPSAIHGMGLFALRNFSKGECLIHYTGKVVTQPPTPNAHGLIYAMELYPKQWLDGSGVENPARFANHSCMPNAETQAEGTTIQLIALSQILVGEEITFDYGFSLADALSHPCHCGAKGCLGRIIAKPLGASLYKHLRIARARD